MTLKKTISGSRVQGVIHKTVMNHTFLSAMLAYLCFSLFIPSHAMADLDQYQETKMSFRNFITCEWTRSDPVDHFNGKPFKIVMINMFDAIHEGNILIVTGAVKSWVVDRYETLFVAVGVKELMDYEKVYYYLVRDSEFTILATELMNYPYNERCLWQRYWIDLK